MSDLFSSLLIFTIIKTILSIFFFTVSNIYKDLVNWALTEIEYSVAGTTTLDRECVTATEDQMCGPYPAFHTIQWRSKVVASVVPLQPSFCIAS